MSALENAAPGFEGDSEPFDVALLRGRYPKYLDLLGTSLKPEDHMDALIVPASRPVENIEPLAELSKRTGTMLITLCSHNATSDAMADMLEDMSVPKWWAIDVPEDYRIPFVSLNSAAFIPEQARRPRRSNLSDKRNIGTAMGKMARTRRILFADDDLKIGESALRTASPLLAGYKIVGLRCAGFPDKAVVDHAEEVVLRHHQSKNRLAYPKAGHISGNSLAVDPDKSRIFFPPEIYDEDLFAAYDMYAEGSAALANDMYYQAEFDPFADPDRARTEEFGEIITHGLYQHLKQRSPLSLTDKRYWENIVAHRRWLINYLLKGVDAPQNRSNFTLWTALPEFAPEQKAKVTASLLAALALNTTVTGKMCVDYYRAWRNEQQRWQESLSYVPDVELMKDAVDFLQLSYATNTE